MKKTISFVLVLLSLLVFSTSALELQSLTFDGNYWFGEGKSVYGVFDPVDSKHNSVTVAASASFSPGLVLGIDYTYGKHSQHTKNGEPPTFDKISEAHQIVSTTLGYTAVLSPGLTATASLGLGAYKIAAEFEEDGEWISVATKTLKPQIGLAAQYQVTPQFSLRSNAATFLGTGGELLLDGSLFGPHSHEVELNLFRWQIEGKYLLKAGWEAVAGYRAWNINIIDEGHEFGLDANGFYIGVRYSF